jgi:hypothetical protein
MMIMNKKIIFLVAVVSIFVFTKIVFAENQTCITSNPSISIFPSNQSGNGTLFYSVNLKNNDNSYCNTTDFRISCSTRNPDLNCYIISSGYPEIPVITESFIPPGYTWTKTIKINSSSTLSQGSYPFTVTIDDGAFDKTVTKSANVIGYYILKPSLLITTDYKTVKFGETFYISANSSSLYKWELWNYDKNYLENKISGVGCSPSGDCTYSFQFTSLKNIRTITIVDLVRKDGDNYTVEKRQTYVTIETTNSTCRNINDQCNSNDECCSKTCVNNKTIGLCKETYTGLSCVDSDNRDYYKKGTIFGLTNINYSAYLYYANWSDVCAKDTSVSSSISDKYLYEYFCYGGYYNSEAYLCPYGCSDGACVNYIPNYTTCTDSDGGKSYYTKGTVTVCSYGNQTAGCGITTDFCTGNVIREGYCEGNEAKTIDYTCPYGCKDGACIKSPSSCVNHAQCSQACDNLGINFKWMGTGSNYKSWTGTCPSNVYGCMSGKCCLGQCNQSGYLQQGTCFCEQTDVVDIYGSVCPSGQTCGSDCYCHPLAIPITEEYKTVNLGETFTVSGTSTYPYAWSIKNYDKNYLELQPIAVMTCKAGYSSSCPYNFEFKAINYGKTTIEIDKINSNDNSIAEIRYIYVTINPSETKIAYLNQPFDLKEKESAEIVDYKNMIVTLDNLDLLATTCPATNVTTGGGGAGCAYGGWVATVSMRMSGGLTAMSMIIYVGETKDTPFGVKIRFDRVDSSIATFTVYQETNEFNFYVKTDKYSYSPGESVIINAILSGYPSSFDFKNAAVITTVTNPDGRQYDVRMNSIGASASACTQSVSTGTYTCSILNEYHFTGTFSISSDASTGNYRVMSTAITSTIKKSAETNFEVEKTYSNYVDVSIDPKEQHTVIGSDVSYQVMVTDKHPVPLCPIAECSNPPCQIPNCVRPTYMYYISVNGLPYNTKYQNVIGLPAQGSMSFTLSVFPSSTGTSEGVTTATTTTGTINPASSEQRIVSVVTGEAIATTPVTTQAPVKEIMFKFTVQATLQDDPRVSGSDGAILFVRFIETPQPPPFPETEKIDITLKNGWNLISAPGYGYFSSGTCSASSKPVAFIYLTDQQKYVGFEEATNIMGTEKLKEYLSTHSFWVYSSENCNIIFNVEKYSSYSGLQLNSGWNLLGVTKDMIGETISNIKGSCTFEKLYSWDADSQKWVAKTENDLIEKMGYGGIVKASSSCSLKTNIIQPPSLPGG